MSQEIRWVQRFKIFDQACNRFEDAMLLRGTNDLEKDGMIRLFSFTLELAWKTMKDFLESEGFQFKPSPKETIRQAFQAGYISNVQPLIDGFEIRNELAHDYSGEKFESAEHELREAVFPALKSLHVFFQKQLDQL